MKENTSIKKGLRYICIKDLYNSKGDIEFAKGNIYLSPKDEYLVREDNEKPEIIGAFLGPHFRPWTTQDAKSLIKKGDIIIAWLIKQIDECYRHKPKPAIWKADLYQRVINYISELTYEPVCEELEEASKANSHIAYPIEDEWKQRQGYCRGYIECAQWQKQEMMKDAVDCMVCKDGKVSLLQYERPAFANILEKYKDGDRVKLIIIKEE